MDPRIDRLDPGDGRRRALLCTAFGISNRRRRLGRSQRRHRNQIVDHQHYPPGKLTQPRPTMRFERAMR
jgi:hypothetical protein